MIVNTIADNLIHPVENARGKRTPLCQAIFTGVHLDCRWISDAHCLQRQPHAFHPCRFPSFWIVCLGHRCL